jgi:hypothetical protein
MYLKVQGGPFSENLPREIEAITDSSRVRPGEERYDEASRSFFLPIIRFPLVEERRFLGKMFPYRRDEAQPIRSLVTIRNVVDWHVRVFQAEELEQVTLLFGVVMQGEKKIVISSVQENSGQACYMVELTIDGLDLELRDIDDAAGTADDRADAG